MVASWRDGGRLTLGDAQHLASKLRPPPVGAAALDWAIDVHLAAAEQVADPAAEQEMVESRGAPSDGTSGPATVAPEVLLASYHAWLKQHGVADGKAVPDAETVRALRAALRSRANLQPGPCFPG